MKSTVDYIVKSLEYKNEYGTLCKTIRGEWVRSKGECIIANYLYNHNINYKYERPAFTDTFWLFSKEISKPDFYLPDYKVFLEYWGLYDATDYRTKREYRNRMAYKQRKYETNNIKYVSLYPDNIRPESVLHRIFNQRLNEALGIQFARSKSEGYCIRSGDRIPFDTDKPLCIDCYDIWNKYQNRHYGEVYCHSCGNKAQTTFAKPLCLACWKKSK